MHCQRHLGWRTQAAWANVKCNDQPITYLDTHAEGDGEGDEDEDAGEEGQDEGAAVRRVGSS